MPLTKIKSLGITDGTILGTDVNSTFDLTGKTVTLPAGTGGKLLQVVSATDSTERSTTSSSFVTASNTLSVTLTPASTSSKIFIIITANINNSSTNDSDCFATIYRNGSTNLGNGNNGMWYQRTNYGGYLAGTTSLSYLDSPSTTSSTTYQLYVRQATSGTMKINGSTSSTPTQSSITAFEIAG